MQWLSRFIPLDFVGILLPSDETFELVGDFGVLLADSSDFFMERRSTRSSKGKSVGRGGDIGMWEKEVKRHG
jgi:hypothetical protein